MLKMSAVLQQTLLIVIRCKATLDC